MDASDGARSRNVRHSRDDVIAAALRILDDLGLPDLTMRRLAASLDVQPSALYWHFPNKQTLLAELADTIVMQHAAGAIASADWRERTHAEATALREALLAYRDGAEVVSSTFAFGLGASAPLERLSSAIRSGGFDDETSMHAATALLHFILGHVSHEQQRMQYDSLGAVAHGAEPDLVASGDGQGEAFDFGVRLFTVGLDGVSYAAGASSVRGRP